MDQLNLQDMEYQNQIDRLMQEVLLGLTVE